MSKHHFAYRKSLEENVLRELDSFKANRLTENQMFRVAAQSEIKDVNIATDQLNKAKKNYVKTTKETKQAEERLRLAEQALYEYDLLTPEQKKEKEANIVGQMFSAFASTPLQERDKQLIRVMKLRNELVLTGDDITLQKHNLLQKISLRDSAVEKVNNFFHIIKNMYM